MALAGVELGGALKNILAIACGISDALDYGNNARAALMTRGAQSCWLPAQMSTPNSCKP